MYNYYTEQKKINEENNAKKNQQKQNKNKKAHKGN